MRCSDCKRYKTGKCYAPTAGEDLESADLFGCFVPTKSEMNEFQKQAYPVSAISIVCLFAVIAQPWTTSAWLWFPGVAIGLALFSLTLFIIIGRELKFLGKTMPA